ncbi:MAG: hypothetical protein A2W90_14385 [Bacteroidetes bacterium GWF2_42_66]|nr:MAG: hypothetical protein A2W92_15780 [Bacteroidetes bacterium GWA2_42_15]OFX99116.1 MAG: hypothetical protein A2W89_06875 [Bacteroidetes bacterium GWE2_42_39]OFY46715.1 MAG: hypothetical protein A2W90_14385 [Bacteroidetes bacterium GWF2_42_66]HBL73880.1 hypothetical protein [Prolixibacteraceae bacterium]HCU63187.1 hypothetical protein [Prolixibacteraceae bacterium]
MKKMLLIVFVLVQLVCRAEYDSTYVLSVTQKYAIPENVYQNDHVGTWMKTWTWQPVGTVSYSIEQNYNNAFSINSSSGLITISDATKINGKVVQQDTLVKLIIRTTDSGEGYELDTARIWVKENSWCKFIDYSYSGTESGTRSQPYNDLDDLTVTVGYGYFVKRGNVILGEANSYRALIASANHPTVFGAYGTGNRPEFNGNNYGGFTFIGEIGNETGGRCEYIYFYDWYVRNYQYHAFKAIRLVGNIGMYNCSMTNNEQTASEAVWVGATSSYADSTAVRPHEFINCVIDTSQSSGMKIGVGPVTVTNCSVNGSGIRLTTGMHGKIRHTLLTNSPTHAIQIRGDYTTVEDCRITDSDYDGIICELNDNPHGPDHITIRNCYIENTAVRAITIWKSSAGANIMHDYTIEDCSLKSGDMGIRINQGSAIIIRRNIITGFGTNGGIRINDQYGTAEADNIDMYYNVFYNNGNDIMALNGSNHKIYNNTSDGNINLTGSTLTTARNNYFKSLTGAATYDHNLDIDTITTANHFQYYANHDYRLRSIAFSSINHGFNVSFTSDMIGTSVPQGTAPDIGAYEYKAGATGNLQIQRNDQKGIKIYPNPATGIVHIRFDNFSENTYQSEWLKVTDLFGRPVLQKHVGAFLKENQGAIDLSGLTKGLYIVRLGDHIIEKLVLQ